MACASTSTINGVDLDTGSSSGEESPKIINNMPIKSQLKNSLRAVEDFDVALRNEITPLIDILPENADLTLASISSVLSISRTCNQKLKNILKAALEQYVSDEDDDYANNVDTVDATVTQNNGVLKNFNKVVDQKKLALNMLLEAEAEAGGATKPERAMENMKSNNLTQRLVGVSAQSLFETYLEFLYPFEILRNMTTDQVPECMWLQRLQQAKQYYCLFCQKSIKVVNGGGHLATITQHTTSKMHANNVTPKNMRALKFYHAFWRTKPLPIQVQQVFYSPNWIEFKCKTCGNVIPATTMLEHMKKHAHKPSEVFELGKFGNERVNTAETRENGLILTESYGISWANWFRTNLPDNYVDCLLCNARFSTFVNDNMTPIRNHINSDLHKFQFLKGERCEVVTIFLSHSNTWGKKRFTFWPLDMQDVYCGVCDTFMQYNNLQSHCNGANHKQNTATYATIPQLQWGKPVQTAKNKNRTNGQGQPVMDHSLHLQQQRHNLINKWFQSRAAFVRILASLLIEASDVTIITNTERCCADLKATIKNTFPQCVVHPFGSRMTGLGNSSSDVDMYVDLDNTKYHTGWKSRYQMLQAMDVVCALIAHDMRTWNQVRHIDSARTPIIRAFNRARRTWCDISFVSGLSVANTNLIRCYLNVVCDGDQYVREFLLITKYWLKGCAFHRRFGSYAMCMMAIFFLQERGYVPSLTQMRSAGGDMDKNQTIIDGWEAHLGTIGSIPTQKSCIPFPHDLEELLADFFEFYSKFKFNDSVVCPLLGYPVPRSWFEGKNVHYLPSEMLKYKALAVKAKMFPNKDFEVMQMDKRMCVQDPFDLAHNLTKAVTDEATLDFQEWCAVTAKMLRKLATSPPAYQ